MNELVEDWIQKAENDLLNVKNNLNSIDIPTDTVCFHCHQSTEKYIKAYLINKNKHFPKIHNLLRLLELCKETDKDFSILKDSLLILNDFSVEIRYPDDWFEPTEEDAREAYYLAKKVKKFILLKIK